MLGIKIIDKVEEVKRLLSEYISDFEITASYGLYIIEDITLPIDEIYNYATLAAKSCKGNVINCYAYYNGELFDKMVAEQEIVNDMNTGIEQEQFQVYLQPKYNLNTNEIAGAEALTRWVHPTKGIISPGEFIPIFESNGFISKLDSYIWEKVCILLHKWKKEGKKILPISVNVSRVDICNPNFVDNILRLVEKYQIPAEIFELEITETAYMDSPTMLEDVMRRLRYHGFKILMDDFGSGHSSLNILKDVDIDVIKINTKFLEKSSHVGRGENIIFAIVRMSKWLGLPVVAEGIETRAQADKKTKLLEERYRLALQELEIVLKSTISK